MPEPTTVDPHALAQIAGLPRTDRPLIICDVDEVVLHFISHLEIFMGKQGYRFTDHRYRLNGNIVGTDGTALPKDAVRALLTGFFDAHTANQRPVDGAAQALATLSNRADIVLLTNLPGRHNKPVRENLLANHGIRFPLVTNSGPKGGAVSALAAGRRQPVVFIDDSPTNLRSVQSSYARATLIQFIADERFFASADPIEGIHLKTNDWRHTCTYIERLLGSKGSISELL
ncbi:hypothetical protein GR183_04490 [Stappia sp. GBMRC 2046]|uniref:HAD family hydrolase n=1 Tax=Stappia sediminis TaxID=2692190 RepID=A0A7X3LS98_9HYPH|nr:hypothetical protein [Stappia sediminis]MXN64151.1 hypothetical protein [Stappia sediminis]